jgi:hypothetical protein
VGDVAGGFVSDAEIVREIRAYIASGLNADTMSMSDSLQFENWAEALDGVVGFAREGDVILTAEKANRLSWLLEELRDRTEERFYESRNEAESTETWFPFANAQEAVALLAEGRQR